ncbi:MAG TPA: hypothetical protein VJ583_03540, partial [Nitrososphaeraceae archaeon]|nr:hypothetical protein [Nitrososphaeraceae archaeon]
MPPLEYEDGYQPEEPFLELRRLKTQEKYKKLIGKTVKDIKCADEYGCLLVIFTDGTELEVDSNECFDFTV